jgi:uncharacterized Ntn-hydrolase superfamily protein
MGQQIIATYSIVGHDPVNGDLGVAVQSKFLAVGAVVPWARSGIGAVATQAHCNTNYGPDGLRLLESGCTAQEALTRLVAADGQPRGRQAGSVDAKGNAATYTGPDCNAWAGGRVGKGYAAQGNILVGQATVDALADTFETTSGPLAERLIAALAAGQAAGGDSRGMESAAILVVRAGGGYSGFNDRYIDLRVDDHPSPIEELRRIMRLHALYFEQTPQEMATPLTEELVGEIQRLLVADGAYKGAVSGIYDEATARAMRFYAGRENLEMREATATHIDALVLDYMREHIR